MDRIADHGAWDRRRRYARCVIKATTGIEQVDRSNRSLEPNIDVLLLLLMIKRRCRSLRKVAFRPRDDLYLLFVVVNPDAPDFGPV
jgi:hypothetical protein